MNRFRVNLHPALFRNNKEVLNGTEDQTVTEVLGVIQYDIREKEFKRIAESVAMDERNNSTREDRDRLRKRLDTISGGKTYKDIWEGKINAGWGHLLTALDESQYFNNKDKEKETKKIMEQYMKEVKKQYKNNIMYADDEKFNSMKDTIFGRDSADYPANKVYCKLIPEAKSIFGVERRARKSTIDATALQGKKYEGPTTDRQDRKFLSNDLPEYLWSIRKTPGILKALSWLPVFSLKEDRPSLVDRDAIDDFLKVASRLRLDESSPYKDKDVAVALFEMFEKNNDLNVNNPSKYKAKLEEYGIKYEEKDFDDILRVGAFYISTQAEGLKAEDQHPIYLSVLEIIRQKGSVKNAITDLKNLVEGAKKTQKTERKEGYESGTPILDNDNIQMNEALNISGKDFKKEAGNLGIVDLTSATRLRNAAKNKNNTRFFSREVLTILADLDNNGVINPNDIEKGGTNTGMQFVEMCKLVDSRQGSGTALNNLIKRAQKQSALLSLGFKANINENSIKSGDPRVILLLQNIISKPGEDLYSLLSGETGNEIIANDIALMEECKKLANEFLDAGKINGKNLKIWLEEQLQKKDRGIDLGFDNFANLQASLATFLYDNYKLGVGIGSTISFDKWAKGLEIGTGLQFRDKGQAALGLGITYKRDINLGKGYTLSPALNAGAFLPIASGSDKNIGSSMGFSAPLDRKTINVDKHTTRHQGMNIGVSYVIGSGAVAYLGYYNTRDKAQNTDIFGQAESQKFTVNTMKIIIDKIVQQNDGVLKLTDENGLPQAGIDDIIKTAVANIKMENVDKDILKAYKRDGMTENLAFIEYKKALKADILRLLAKYDGVKIDQNSEPVILYQIREDYERLREESYKNFITKGVYFSGFSVGIYAGTGGLGGYLAGNITNHDTDAYGFRKLNTHKLSNDRGEEGQILNEAELEPLNTMLRLTKEEEKLSFASDGIIIPKETLHKVKVSDDMKNLMVKYGDGNVKISRRTPLHTEIENEGTSNTAELCLGKGDEKSDFKYYLDTLNSDRFGSDMTAIDSRILKERNKLHYTVENFKNKLGELKVNDVPCILEEKKAQLAEIIISKIKEISGEKIETDKKLKITIEKKWNSEYEVNVREDVLGSGFEIEYMEQRELFDSKAKAEAQKVYNWAAELEKTVDVLALYNVKHSNQTVDYDNFARELYAGNFEIAKTHLKRIIEDLPNFPDIKWPENNNEALGQLLMSINNIFARAKNVIGKGARYDENSGVRINEYEIDGKKLGDIIETRAEQLTRTIKSKQDIPGTIRDAYTKCIAAMEAAKKDDEWYDKNAAPSASLNNTVGFNLGDRKNPENPLPGVQVFDKIYNAEKLVSQDGFTDDHREELHEHVMKKFIENKALFSAIGQTIGKNHDEIVKALNKATFKLNGNTGELRLDFDEENYIVLSADMKLGYYTQCVNHTVILDNIYVETQDATIPFYSQAWDGDSVTTTTTDGILATVTSQFGVSATNTGREKKGKSFTDPREREHDLNPTNPDGTTPTTPSVNNGQNGKGDINLPW